MGRRTLNSISLLTQQSDTWVRQILFYNYSLHNIIVVGINLGLYIVIVDRLKVNVVRVYVGTLMTSLEMAGVSLTLLQTPSQWVELLGKLWAIN